MCDDMGCLRESDLFRVILCFYDDIIACLFVRLPGARSSVRATTLTGLGRTTFGFVGCINRQRDSQQRSGVENIGEASEDEGVIAAFPRWSMVCSITFESGRSGVFCFYCFGGGIVLVFDGVL